MGVVLRIIITVGCLGIIVLLALIFWVLSPVPVRLGGGIVSPDGNHQASLRAVQETRWFFQPECYYEFILYGPANDSQKIETNYSFATYPTQMVRVPVASENHLIKRRGTPPFPIEWSNDSKTVKTKINNTEIVFHIDQTIEQ